VGHSADSPDGKYPVQATFREPGTFVVRVLAHDGGFETLRTSP